MNVNDIFKSWVKTMNPTDEQKQIALQRLSICNQCPSKQKSIGDVYVCGECSCPISFNDTPIGKLYSDEECPLSKWEGKTTNNIE